MHQYEGGAFTSESSLRPALCAVCVEVCTLSALCAVCVEVCALSALCAIRVEVCALSALCAIRVGFGGVRAGFRVLCFGPETCGPSSTGGGSPVDKTKAQ
jgi:hypothetical protein